MVFQFKFESSVFFFNTYFTKLNGAFFMLSLILHLKTYPRLKINGWQSSFEIDRVFYFWSVFKNTSTSYYTVNVFLQFGCSLLDFSRTLRY